MIDMNKERELFEEAFLSVGGKQRELELEDGEYTNSKSLLGWELWQIKAKAQAIPTQKFFSHDFNGDGFKYHDSLEEAQKETESSLDWYRDRVADGHHVGDDGEFFELCYGLVIASAGYTVDDVVTEKHHQNDEFTKYEVGTEILTLHLDPCKSESGA